MKIAEIKKERKQKWEKLNPNEFSEWNNANSKSNNERKNQLKWRQKRSNFNLWVRSRSQRLIRLLTFG